MFFQIKYIKYKKFHIVYIHQEKKIKSTLRQILNFINKNIINQIIVKVIN